MKLLARAKKIITPILVILFLFNSTPPVQAHGGSSNQAVKFEHLTIDDGLASNFTTAVLQDKQGFMWFGTRNGGLNKYDGIEFTTYTHDPDNPNSLGNNYVWYLLEDSQGIIWICLWGGGLDKFDPVSETFTHYRHDEKNPDSLSNDLVWSVYEDSQGTLWVATDGGLDKFDPVKGTFTHYRHDATKPQSLSTNSLTQIFEDATGSLWIGTYGGGLNKFDPKNETFTHYQHDPNKPNSLSNDFIWSIYGDSQGIIWLGTEGGLDKFDPKNETFTHYQHDPNKPNSLSHDTVTDIEAADTGKLWVGTYSGVNKFDPVSETFSYYQYDPTDPHSLSNNLVWYVYVDNTSTLWVMTDGGVNRYDPSSERFALYEHNPENPNSLSSDLVSAIYEDSQGILWLGTKGGGLNKFDREQNKFVHYQHVADKPNHLSDNDVMAIQPDSNGMLWLATEGGGFNQFDPVHESFTSYQHDPNNANSLQNDSVADIEIDATGILWIGTYGGGLDRFDPKTETFTHYTQEANKPNSLASPWVRTVYVDSKGYVWVGAEGGLSRFEPKSETFTNYLPNEKGAMSLSNDTIGVVYEDSKGMIWIGTNDGLNKFDPSTDTFSVYREKQGLAGNGVNGILEDNQGMLWVGTNKGLSKFDPQKNSFRNYDVGDGLQSNLFLLHSAYKSHRGELFFGGVGGFNAFYPDKLTDNPHAPVVVLTDFQVFNRPVTIGPNSPLAQHINWADEITLAYNQSLFSFKFAALNYRAPQKNRYAYMMEGFDQDWTYVNSDRRFASYTNLDPGRYTFRVKASNNDNVWNETGTSIKITIVPPFWRTWWFQGGMGLLAFGLVFGGFALRTRAIQAQKRHLEKVVHERTLELQEKNGLLQHQAEILETQQVQLEQRTIELEAQALQLQVSKQNTEMLYTISQRMLLASNLTELIRVMVEEAPIAVINRVALFSFEYNLTGEMVAITSQANWYSGQGMPPTPIGTRYERDKVAILNLFVTETPVLLNDPFSDKTLDEATQAIAHRLNIQCMAVLPLWSQGQQLGVLLLQGEAPHAFTEQEIRPYHAMLGQLSVAVENQRLLQQTIQAKEEAEQARARADLANQAKSDFLSRMSHELRTPLNGILGYAQILKSDPTISRKQWEGVTVIQQSGEHLLTLITDILDLAKIEAGKFELLPTPIQLDNFMQNTLAIVQMRAEKKRLGLQYQPLTLIPHAVSVDEKRLRQVLLNLLNNAIKFTEKGSITLQLGVIDQPQLNEVKLRFAVNDTGIGMTPEQLQQIFNPFEQVGDMRKRAEGTGLGLAISKQLVEAMGGTLLVESTYQVGSTFWFEVVLPLTDAALIPATVLPTERIIGYEGQRRKILIVDDKIENRLVFLNILEPLGFRIAMAENGEEALEQTENWLPDLILMDMIMPKMTGFEAIQAIRNDHNLKTIAIIGTSASVFEKDAEENQLSGCDAFISKPVQIDELLSFIQQLLHLQWQYQQPATEEVDTPPPPAPLPSPLPRDMVQRWRDLVEDGDLLTIEQESVTLMQTHPQFASFIEQKIKPFTSSWDIEGLTRFLEELLQ